MAKVDEKDYTTYDELLADARRSARDPRWAQVGRLAVVAYDQFQVATPAFYNDVAPPVVLGTWRIWIGCYKDVYRHCGVKLREAHPMLALYMRARKDEKLRAGKITATQAVEKQINADRTELRLASYLAGFMALAGMIENEPDVLERLDGDEAKVVLKATKLLTAALKRPAAAA